MADTLHALGAEVRFMDTGHAQAPVPMQLGSTSAPVDFTAAFVDAVPMAVPRAFMAEGSYWLHHDWQQDWAGALGRRALFEAALGDLERRGVTLVSSPLSATAYNKPAQLTALSRAGFAMPRFVITNDAKAARTFLRGCKDAVMKPAIGGGYCVPVTARQVESETLNRTPAIFQQRVRGDDIRITAVRGEILSAVRIVNDGADASLPDFRAQRAYHQGTTRYEPIKTTTKLTRLCTRILETCAMHFGGIDFKRDASGELHLLECNAQPGWLAIEKATGAKVCEGLARYLLTL